MLGPAGGVPLTELAPTAPTDVAAVTVAMLGSAAVLPKFHAVIVLAGATAEEDGPPMGWRVVQKLLQLAIE